MDESIGAVTTSAEKAQDLVFDTVISLINRFEIKDGRFVTTQGLSARLALLQRKIEAILGDVYAPSVKDYLPIYTTIEETTVALQKSYNDLEIKLQHISPARKLAYDQAEYYLNKAVADAYIQPVKYLLMQQVTSGLSIADSKTALLKWSDGDLTTGAGLVSGRPTPNLQKYATQVARDTAYKYQGAVNEIIAKHYRLESFIYVGGIIEDTRPICRHLVELGRAIALDEMPALIKEFPQGLYPDTTKNNFIQNCGGYNCRHSATPVKTKTETPNPFIHPNADPSDLKRNTEIANLLASKGYQVEVREHSMQSGVKNPELLVEGVIMDHKEPEPFGKSPYRNIAPAIKNNVKRALNQGADGAVISLSERYNLQDVIEGIGDSFHFHDVKKIYVNFKDTNIAAIDRVDYEDGTFRLELSKAYIEPKLKK